MDNPSQSPEVPQRCGAGKQVEESKQKWPNRLMSSGSRGLNLARWKPEVRRSRGTISPAPSPIYLPSDPPDLEPGLRGAQNMG